MLVLTIGYTEKGPLAEPIVLYAGRDSAAADRLSLDPPPGVIRTEVHKNPIVYRRRVFAPAPPAPAESVKETARKSPKPSQE